jgi:hypothetical protein
MDLIEKEAGLDGLVTRPLSAKLLPPTIPEKMGWISRERMLNISGRSRKPQITLAKNLGIRGYPCAAGGCLLTDPEFARRIKDLLEHSELDISNINLLKWGRYFRLSKDARLMVGRNENDNKMLTILAKDSDYLFGPTVINGPIAVGRGRFTPDLIEAACRIVARYCDRNGERETDVAYRKLPESEETRVRTAFLEEDQLAKLRVSARTT